MTGKNIDIDEIRAPQIKMHGLTGADNVYTFFYDETNNVRKLHINTKGLNIPTLKVFTLGGVVYKGKQRSLDIHSLRKEMRIQASTPEVKLEHVSKGDFLELLRSEKLNIFLNWVISNDLMIHFHALDPFYWSIVDIIDSVLIEKKELYPLHLNIKAELLSVLRSNLPITIKIFQRYNYPALLPADRKPFLNDLIELVVNTSVGQSLSKKLLTGVLQMGRQLDALDFIEGFSSGVLIDDFSIFYLNRIAVFKNSEHILDEEPSIEKRLLQHRLVSRGKPVTNFRFVNSKDESGIQVSDILAGLLGKLFSFFTEVSLDEAKTIRASLEGISFNNAQLIARLIDTANSENVAFIHNVLSVQDLEKQDLFLRF